MYFVPSSLLFLLTLVYYCVPESMLWHQLASPCFMLNPTPAEPASAPVVAKGVQRGWGTVRRWGAPRCATSPMSAATPVPNKNVMSQYSLLFISFTLLTLHCHTHCWLGWVNTKCSAVCIVYWHLTPQYDMLILLHTTKSSFRSQKAYKFLSTPWSEWVYMISGVQKEEFKRNPAWILFKTKTGSG